MFLRGYILLVGILIASAIVCAACASIRHKPPPVDLLEADCDEGFTGSSIEQPLDHPLAPELQRMAHTKVCAANPEICYSNADCSKNYECSWKTQSFVPAGAGVCWPRVETSALGP
jgi:hypothetical protein